MTTEWPAGAIKTNAEIDQLLEKAKLEPVFIYKVRNAPAIIKCILDEKSCRETSRYSGTAIIKCRNSIITDWYSLDKRIPDRKGFLFSNYWHAWGYRNRMHNGQMEKS